MKTEAQIKAEIKTTESALKKTRKQFERYDNHDDMDEIERLVAELKALKWVLE